MHLHASLARFVVGVAVLAATLLASAIAAESDSAKPEPAKAEPAKAEPAKAVEPPHLALILPIKAAALATPADLVLNGALAAERALADERTPKLRLYATTDSDDDTVAAYKQAISQGAVGIIGPLTRGGIAKLAALGQLEVPVLALNNIDERTQAGNLYSLGLSIETEARQMAGLLQGDGPQQPVIVQGDGAMAQRIQAAFTAEWKTRTGIEPKVFKFTPDKSHLTQIKTRVQAAKADAVFLAVDAKQARLLRPYLGNDVPLYATSQIWGGRFGKLAGNGDLLGIRFVDMPWLLDPYHPDIAQFKRLDKTVTSDLERLYALGIDAYRLSLVLMFSAPGAAIELQGVTGALHMADGHQFNRVLMRSEVGGQPATPAPEQPKAEQPAEPAVR